MKYVAENPLPCNDIRVFSQYRVLASLAGGDFRYMMLNIIALSQQQKHRSLQLSSSAIDVSTTSTAMHE